MKTCTSWPSSMAVRATSSASAPRVGFSGPVARWMSSFAMPLLVTQTGVRPTQVRLARLELLEQVDQLLALLAINSGAQSGLIVDGDLAGLVEHPAPLAREVQPAHAAVLGVGPPLAEPCRLQVVHHRDHPARGHAQALRKGLLRLPIGRGHEAHQQELARSDGQRLPRPPAGPSRGETP